MNYTENKNTLLNKPIFELDFEEMILEMLLTNVPVKLIKTDEFTELETYLKKIGTYDAVSETYKIPLFLAHELLLRGLCEIDVPYFNNPSVALRYFFQERSSSTLQKLPTEFVTLLIEKLKYLEYINKKAPTPTSINDAQKLQLFLMDLIDVRMSKLFKAIKAGDAQSFYDVLTQEEQVLFKKLLESYQKWLEKLGIKK
ncbi:MAG: hypothetical protein ACP6IS_09445 [Candidatus Asgardarchaeia archaeon]